MDCMDLLGRRTNMLGIELVVQYLSFPFSLTYGKTYIYLYLEIN